LKQYDTVVVGGSAAGLHAARRLAQGGARVLVLERNQTFGTPTRTLIVTPELERFLAPLPGAAVLERIGRIEMISPGARAVVNLGRPDYVVDRGKINTALAERAEQEGVEILHAANLVSLAFDPDGARLRAEISGSREVEVRSPTILGADGVRSLVARAMRVGPPATAPILQAVVRFPGGSLEGRAQVWFDPAVTRYLLWLVPHSDGTGVVGLVGARGSSVRRILDDFLKRAGYSPLCYQGAVIPLHTPRRRLETCWAGGRALLVGDAAGHVKVTTFGGLVSGLWGAEAAAESILRGTPYGRALRPLNRELYFHDALRWVLNRFTSRDYDVLLGSLGPRARSWLEEHNRDMTSAAPLGLLSAQPGLIFLAAQAMIRAARRNGSEMRASPSQPGEALHSWD
jgi:flavin-dependent dehydrogenase